MKKHLFAVFVAITAVAVLLPGAGAEQPGVGQVAAPVFVLPASAVTGGGTVTSAQLLAPDGMASAPSYSFASSGNSDTGWYLKSAGIVILVTDGGEQVLFDGTTNPKTLHLNAAQLGFSAGGAAIDVSLSRCAANCLGLAAGDGFNIVSGSATMAPLTIGAGTNLTTAAAGAVENDGAAFYITQNTTNGRTYDDGWNYFRLTGSGSGISSIADFFGANSAIPLVANGVYEIEWEAWFSQATAGTATWTVTTATTNLANLTGTYTCTNIAGIGAVGAPQSAGVNVTASSATAFPVTGSMANGATHRCRIQVMLTAGNGTSNTRLRLTMSAGTATPLINSYFRVRRLPGGNTGAFVP